MVRASLGFRQCLEAGDLEIRLSFGYDWPYCLQQGYDADKGNPTDEQYELFRRYFPFSFRGTSTPSSVLVGPAGYCSTACFDSSTQINTQSLCNSKKSMEVLADNVGAFIITITMLGIPYYSYSIIYPNGNPILLKGPTFQVSAWSWDGGIACGSVQGSGSGFAA